MTKPEPTVTHHPRYSPDTPEQGNACLMCTATNLPVGPTGRIIPAHHDPGATGEPKPICLGAGYVRRLDDGLDDVRRHAIRQHRAVLRELAPRLAKMREAVDDERTLADIIERHTPAMISLQTQAQLWRELAVHGRWEAAVHDMLHIVASEQVSSSAVVNANTEYRRYGARQWWHGARMEVYTAWGDSIPVDVFTAMMMGI